MWTFKYQLSSSTFMFYYLFLLILHIEIQRFLPNFDLALLGVKGVNYSNIKLIFEVKSCCNCNNKLEWNYPKLPTQLLFFFFSWARSFLCWPQMRLSTRSLSILCLDSMTSEFEKKYIYMYYELKKALHSCKEKGIHWNPNLSKCTAIGKFLLYWMTSILELVHLFHRFY